jgi:hypothetical protein
MKRQARYLGTLAFVCCLSTPALADQVAVNKCGSILAKKIAVIIKLMNKFYLSCYAARHACALKPVAEQQACLDATLVDPKPCSCAKLDIDDPASKAGRKLLILKEVIAKSCTTSTCVRAGFNQVLDSVPGGDDVVDPDPYSLEINTGPDGECDTIVLGDDREVVRQGDTPPLTLAELLGIPGPNPSSGLNFSTQNDMCGDIVGIAPPNGTLDTYLEVEACIQLNALEQTSQQIGWDADPRARQALFDIVLSCQGGVIGVAIGPVRVVPVIGGVLDPGAVPFGGGGKLRIDVKKMNVAREVKLGVPGPKFKFDPWFLPGVTVCTEQVCDGEGVVCCDPAGCPGLGDKSFDMDQDHDSSGTNAGLGFAPGEVPPGAPPDPGCVAVSTNAVSTLTPFKTTACSEEEARSGACNRTDLGENNPVSHAPRCIDPFLLGEPRVGRFCDPALAAIDCPVSLLCTSLESSFGLAIFSPCNGPVTAIPVPAAFAHGDMVLTTPLQFTFHRTGLDVENFCNNVGNCGGSLILAGVCFPFPGDTCCNGMGDTIPDGYGCDGIPCTDDDVTPPKPPITVAWTTGTTSATVFDVNMATPGLPLSTPALTGAKPADGCAKLQRNDLTGYTLKAAVPLLDDETFGDIVLSLSQTW